MNATSTLRPSASSPFRVHGPSAMTWPFLDVFALVDQDFLVDARGGVRAHEFADRINPDALLRLVFDLLFAFGQLAVFGDDDLIAGDRRDLAAFLGNHDGARVAGDAVFEAGATSGASVTSSGTAWRCMFEPINARFASSCSRNGISDAAIGHELFRRHVHVIHPRRLDFDEVRPGAAHNAVGEEVALAINRRVRLRDDELFLAVGGQIFDLVGDAAVLRPCDKAFRGNQIR